MELGRALEILRRRWPVVVVAVLVASTVAWFTAPEPEEVVAPRRVTEYTGSQTLVRSTDAPASSTSSSQVSLPLLVRLAEMGDVPAAVIDRLGLDTSPDQLASRVEVEVDTGLGIITISSSGTDQDEVVSLVAAYAEELLRFAADRNESLRADALERIRRLVAQQQQRVRELDAELLGLPPDSVEWLLVRAERDALVATYGRNLQTMEELVSQPPSDPGMARLGEVVAVPTSTSVFAPPPAARSPRALAGAALGLLLGLGLALAVDRTDRRLHTRDQLEAAYDAPVLSEIELPPTPATPTGILEVPIDDDSVQAFARLGVAVLHRSHPADPVGPGNGSVLPRLVLVTSAGPGEGRTTALVHLAGAMAATGHRVLVTATGDHWRDAASALSVEEKTGGGVLSTTIPGVYLSGDKLSHQPDLGVGLSANLARFDLVLVDAGPVLGSGDAAGLLHDVDGVLVVARQGHSRRDSARRAREYLEQVGVSTAGVLLLRFRRRWLQRPRDASSARAEYRRRASAALRTAIATEGTGSRQETFTSRRGALKR